MATAPARRARVSFVCSQCGVAAPKWQGRCDGCGAWNSLEEELVRPPAGAGGARVLAAPRLLSLAEAQASGPATRLPVGAGEVDRVLGGGIVAGSLVLLGGDPGIGKSTLALDLARRCGTASRPTLYAAGEESAGQVAMRAARIGCAGSEVAVYAETDLDAVVAAIEAHRPALAVVDSVQTVHSVDVPGGPGSVSQVREAAVRLLRAAKVSGTAIILVGHVTKDGAIAGPRTLEHMVDVVLYLEGERHGDHRLLRGIKNRFGATDELGILVLDDAGIHEAPLPGRAFLEASTLGVPGTALTVTCEGSRPLAVEVQALAVPTSLAIPRRTVSGVDFGRLCLLLAVLQKRAGFDVLGKSDVYVNAAGGVRLGEPAVDLAIVLAVASAARDRPLPEGLVAVGEVGLSGEVRSVRRLEHRLAEAATLGLDVAVIPDEDDIRVPPGLQVCRAGSIRQALEIFGITR